jgi:hypothetical protein
MTYRLHAIIQEGSFLITHLFRQSEVSLSAYPEYFGLLLFCRCAARQSAADSFPADETGNPKERSPG